MRGLIVSAVAVVAGAAANASASPAAVKPVKSYCSLSGDVCFGIVDRSGAIHLELDTAARYFARYRLCVRAPGGTEVCKSYPVRRRGQLWGSSVRWYRNFPNKGPGEYRVTWKLGSSRLGPTLRFRIPTP